MDIKSFNEFIKVVEERKIKLKRTRKKKRKIIIQLETFINIAENRKIRVLSVREREIWNLLIKSFKRDLMGFSLMKIRKLKQWKREGMLDFVTQQHFDNLIKRSPDYFDDLLLEVMKKSEIKSFKEKYLRNYHINSIYYYIDDWELIRKEIDYEEIKNIQERIQWLIKRLKEYDTEITNLEKRKKVCLDIHDQLNVLRAKLEPMMETSFDLEEMLTSLVKKEKPPKKDVDGFANKLIAFDDELDQINLDYKEFQGDYRKIKKEFK
jgi:hypothetical protein